MIALPAVPKLAKLIPLLASDKDGEVVAAARTIGRTLEAVKADFHDLARASSLSKLAPGCAAGEGGMTASTEFRTAGPSSIACRRDAAAVQRQRAGVPVNATCPGPTSLLQNGD